MRKLCTFLSLFLITTAFSQTARQVGLRENTPAVFAFTNAHIMTSPGNSLQGATMLVRNGIIEAVGNRVSIPADAQVIDLDGKTVYPGFIDLYADYGLADPAKEEMVSQAHWSPQVRSFYQAGDVFRVDEKEASGLRAQGFTLAHIVPQHGIFAGQGALVSLGEGELSRVLIGNAISQAMSLQRSAVLDRGYPHSIMGAFSMIRQTLYDAGWIARAYEAYAAGTATGARPETNQALQILANDLQAGKPFVMEIPDEQWLLRAESLTSEFGVNLWVKASGYEYRREDQLTGIRLPMIVSLDFPKAPDVGTPEASMQVSLEELRHWYMAPDNPATLANSNITFALSCHGLDKKEGFLDNLRKAVSRGLSETEALAALTTTPAKLLGIENRFGTLGKGKAANFIVASGNVFADDAEVEQVWIDGQPYQVKPLREDPRGEWLVTSPASLNGMTITLEGEMSRLRGTATLGEKQTRLMSVKTTNERLTFRIRGDSLGLPATFRFSGLPLQTELLGIAEDTDGEIFSWQAARQNLHIPEKRNPDKPQEKSPDIPLRYPSLDYGITKMPEQPIHLLIRNATIWTQGPQGRLEEADMLISKGKIAEVRTGIVPPPQAVIIDGSGMHVTPGLIDPHLHTSIAGNVNETANAITSDTRILDVIDANNVWIYRLLAGGLTTAKLFHGSANPIGGQDAVIKMRWGMPADRLIMREAKPGLKFALGENVKRSPDRYPNTRMGTEQIIRDAFEAALQYESDWNKWELSQKGIPPRRDLQLEPILEVLRGDRLSHVHAYRQDEMLMMMRLAEEYGFTVTAFEHTLEGYKIADELREHGAAAVVWTDWSSFKVEATDGILHNARLLTDAGVLTSLHSDNTQLSTRMNWEAAKAMKTGIPDEDALSLITLFPARILHIDHLVGSLEEGKDADFVIWNGHPMSAFTTAEQTWIEGRKYFDRQDDKHLQQDIKQERAMIIRHILESQTRENNQ